MQIADGKYSLEKLKTAFNAIVGTKVNNITMTETGKVGTAQEVIDYINAFDNAALEVFNLTKAIGKRADGSIIYDTTAKQKLINDAINLQNLAQGDFINLKNLSVNTDFGLAMQQVFAKPVELQTNLEKITRVITRGTRAQNNAQRRNVRAGLLQYIFSTNSGVVKQLKENSAFGNAGDFRLDSGKLQEIVEQINNTPGFKKIFNKKDMDVLNGINQYMLTINKGMNDVGASLSGAQVIGGILEGVTNLNAGQATSGILRLAGQNRLARVFLSPVVTDMFTGASLKNIRTNKDKLKEIFLGKQSFAAVVTNIALDPSAGLFEQTDEMLSTPETFSEEEKDVLKQFNLIN
jgi:hypothetical protein